MSKIKAIIFDFDGVIVESMGIKADGFAHIFRDRPDKVAQIVEYHLAHGGMGRMEKFENIYRLFLNKKINEKEKLSLSKDLTDYVYKKVVECPFVTGAKEFLQKHKDEYKFFIVSGTPDGEIKSIVNDRGLSPYFIEVLGSPDKKSVLNRRILQNYSLKPDETAFVGDSIDDYEGIKDTGIIFIGRITRGSDPFNTLPVKLKINDLVGMERLAADGKI
ncbi:MAG: HAD family hydrolase [Candidatus Margulisiibacteriota bacterium]